MRLFVLLVSLLCATGTLAVAPAKTTGCNPLHGVTYDPFALSTENICLSNQQVAIDMKIIATFSKSIRLYSLSTCPEATKVIMAEARKLGLTVMLGVYIGAIADRNEAELKMMTSVMKQHADIITAVVVGNDAIVNGKIGSNNRFARFMNNVELLLDFISEVRKIMKNNGWTHPVTTSEGWGVWESEHGSALVKAVDFICLKIRPYNEGRPVICGPNAKSNCISSAVYANAKATGLSQFYKKNVWVCETGWPTSGKRCCRGIPSKKVGFLAVPHPVAASRYLNEFVDKIGARPYYISSAFDNDWRRVWSPCPNCAEKNLALSSFKDGICDLCDQEYITGVFDLNRERKSSYKLPPVRCPLPSLPQTRIATPFVAPSPVKANEQTTPAGKKRTTVQTPQPTPVKKKTAAGKKTGSIKSKSTKIPTKDKRPRVTAPSSKKTKKSSSR